MPAFRRFLFWITVLFYLQVPLLALGWMNGHDPGVLTGLGFAIFGALAMTWAYLRSRHHDLKPSADVLMSVLLTATLVAAYSSPDLWAVGILPVLAASFIMPYFEGPQLKRRLWATWGCALFCLITQPFLPHGSVSAGWFRTWYPVITVLLTLGLVYVSLLLFKRSLNVQISEKQRFQSEATEQMLLYRQIVEASGQGVWMLDSQLNDTYVNERLMMLLGMNGSARSQRVIDLIDSDDQARVLEHLRRGRTEPIELNLVKRAEEQRRVLLSLSYFADAQGQQVGVLGMFTDISSRRALDERLRLGERLDSVGRLAGSLAADFERLVDTVGQALSDLEKVSLPEASRADLLAMQNAQSRASGLVRQLLAVGSKQPVLPQRLDVGSEIKAMMPMLTQLCTAGVLLHAEISEGLGMVKADPSQLQQVILNLMINARDAMPRGGEISVRLSWERPSALDARRLNIEPGRDFVVLTVQDQGDGIASENLPRIFEPFFSTKGRGKGTGLGLATVYGIVKQNHGAVTVDSQLGQGSRFEIYLPLDEGAS